MNLVKSIYMVFTIIVCVVLFALFYGDGAALASSFPQENSETIHEIAVTNHAHN